MKPFDDVKIWNVTDSDDSDEWFNDVLSDMTE